MTAVITEPAPIAPSMPSMLHDGVLGMIGNTPMVDVSNLSPNPDVRILAKMEMQNPFGSVKDRIAKRMIEISRHGLKRRAYVDAAGNDESGFLNWLQDVAESGKTSADHLLDLYHGEWNGSVDPIFEFQRY